jgi:lysophospholipase L1-like esterase
MTVAGAIAPYSSYQLLPLYRSALASKPNIVIVALGTNDAALPLDAARRALFVQDYGKLLADFRRVAPKARLYLCVPPAAYGPSLFRAQNIQQWIGPLIRQIAAQNGLPVIDLFTPTSNKPQLFPDSLHPNDAGARKLAAEMKRALLAP